MPRRSRRRDPTSGPHKRSGQPLAQGYRSDSMSTTDSFAALLGTGRGLNGSFKAKRDAEEKRGAEEWRAAADQAKRDAEAQLPATLVDVITLRDCHGGVTAEALLRCSAVDKLKASLDEVQTRLDSLAAKGVVYRNRKKRWRLRA